jgi:hypothetical protein
MNEIEKCGKSSQKNKNAKYTQNPGRSRGFSPLKEAEHLIIWLNTGWPPLRIHESVAPIPIFILPK